MPIGISLKKNCPASPPYQVTICPKVFERGLQMKTAQAIVRPASQIIPTDYQCWYLCCLITMALFGHSKNIFFYLKKIKTNKKYI